MANPAKITPERLAYLHSLSRETLVHMVENGELPPELGEQINVDEALAELDRLWETHKGALVGAGVDYVFGLLNTLSFPRVDLANFEQIVESLSDEDLISFMELSADAAEAQKQILVDARADLIADLHATASWLAKAALASALGAALGLPSAGA